MNELAKVVEANNERSIYQRSLLEELTAELTRSCNEETLANAKENMLKLEATVKYLENEKSRHVTRQ